MRWFKHMTRSWDDEKIAELVERAGLEGYGFYFRLLEIVAANIEESSDAVVTYSLQRWSKLTAIFQPKVLRLCQVCSELDLIEFQLSANLLKVSIPKIFKYRDEHTRKQARLKPKTPESLRTNSGQTPEQELDTDIDTEAEENPAHSAKNPSSKSGKNVPGIIIEMLRPLNKISPSPLEIKNLSEAAKAGCTPQTVKNLLKRKPAITGFTHSWQIDELVAQKRIDDGLSANSDSDIMAELERRFPNGGGGNVTN